MSCRDAYSDTGFQFQLTDNVAQWYESIFFNIYDSIVWILASLTFTLCRPPLRLGSSSLHRNKPYAVCVATPYSPLKSTSSPRWDLLQRWLLESFVLSCSYCISHDAFLLAHSWRSYTGSEVTSSSLELILTTGYNMKKNCIILKNGLSIGIRLGY